MLRHILTSNTNKTDDLILTKAMSRQPIEPYPSTWHAAPPSTSVTGTSELFSSTFAMLSDNNTYQDPWGANKTMASQAILFEQPHIQPVIGNSYDPPVRFDPPGAYRQPTYLPTPSTVAAAAAQYYQHQQQQQQQQQHPAGRQFLQAAAVANYQHQQQQQQQHQNLQQQQQQQHQFFATTPVTTTTSQLTQTQQLLMAQHNNNGGVGQVMRPEPLRPTNQKNGHDQSMSIQNRFNRSNSNSSTPPHSGRQTGGGNNGGGPSAVSPCDDVSLNSPALTSSGSAASGTPPLTADALATDVEGTDEERVMCMACRGVYPSRRSLTGHIGRNEKCREIIGRNYLDALANGTNPPVPGTDAAIKSGAITTGQDGMSPVCPYCDRFISHYKGNIRRHINQCCKNTEPLKRSKIEGKEGGQGGPKKKRRRTEDGFHQPDFNDYDNNSMMGVMTSPQMSPPSSSYYGGSDLCSPNGNGYSNGGAGGAGVGGGATFDGDAYICEDCDFVTVYKGNMKRHLNTCHPLPDCKNLKVIEWDTKLESMRASNMGIVGDRLQEKLAAHKQNSSRGRKPRKKKENQNSEESEVMMEEYKPLSSSSEQKYMTFAQ